MQKVLFWSGGKDSLLARYYLKKDQHELILFTTYDEDELIVPHQNIPVSYIQKQAVFFNHTLVAVPLPHPCSNEVYLERVVASLGSIPHEIGALVFGDWHLQEIREWRENAFEKHGLHCEFPIWKKPIEELLTSLDTMRYKIIINNVADEFRDEIIPGEAYNREFISKLPDTIDPMGENGEFHTWVVVEAGEKSE